MIFRIHGTDNRGNENTIDIEATSESQARHAAVTLGGFSNTKSVEIVSDDLVVRPVRTTDVRRQREGSMRVEHSAWSAFRLGFYFTLGAIAASLLVSLFLFIGKVGLDSL